MTAAAADRFVVGRVQVGMYVPFLWQAVLGNEFGEGRLDVVE